jgi:hypothetical protein
MQLRIGSFGFLAHWTLEPCLQNPENSMLIKRNEIRKSTLQSDEPDFILRQFVLLVAYVP